MEAEAALVVVREAASVDAEALVAVVASPGEAVAAVAAFREVALAAVEDSREEVVAGVVASEVVEGVSKEGASCLPCLVWVLHGPLTASRRYGR